MTQLPLVIRPEAPGDAEAIERLHERAFGPGRFARTAFRLREGAPHLPGGGVEPGETALESLGRELVEEACIAPAEEPVLHGIFFNRRASPRDHVLVYVLRRFEVLAQKRPDREIAESGWFPVGALPPDASRPTRERLAEIAGQRPIAPDW